MLKTRLLPHIRFAYLFLVSAAFFGLLYALQLIGIATDTIRPDLVRSVHISLMLYGFIPLMMTLLPFALFEKEGVITMQALAHLERFLWLWYLFLIFMIFSLLGGATRGLPFYDFPYELNALLAFAGLFYMLAIFTTIRRYSHIPRWVKVAFTIVIISPLALLVLMSPKYGQVEKMLQGPHGDNTLGMSFALVIVYYLVIKLSSKKTTFQTKWHFLWQIPLTAYLLSVLYRIFIGTLSYHAEWFLQYLTLLYIPLLWRWWKDAQLHLRHDRLLFISISAFLFADIEGNILFIPTLRKLFHRNDLVVGHAHIAVGIGLLFLALAIIKPFWEIEKKKAYYFVIMMSMMALVLTISGIQQAGFLPLHTHSLWQWRALFGGLFAAGLLYPSSNKGVHTLFAWPRHQKAINFYHIAGFLSDGIGGIILLLFGKPLYEILGEIFQPGYQQIVFGFVTATGLIHLAGILMPHYADTFAKATLPPRILTAAGFFSLWKNGTLGWIAPMISTTDLLFVLVYLLYLKQQDAATKQQ